MYPLQNKTDLVEINEIMLPMRDGIRLYTRAVIPAGQEKCPIIFIRTPYEAAHDGIPHAPEEYATNVFIREEYALVLQHCRGCGDSEGECHPYIERNDGLDTLDYLRTLPFYNGEIFLYGESYLATVHFCYLNTQPPDIKGAAFSIQTDRMFFRNYRNGCCNQHCYLSWWLRMLKRRYPVQHKEGNVVRPYQDMMQKIIGTELPEYTNNLLHPTYDEYWKSDPRDNVVENLHFPLLLNEGWFDFYLEGMFSIWERLPQATKEKSAMVVGPYGHATQCTGRSTYPLTHGNPPAGTVEGAVTWFNSLRQGTVYPYAELGKVTYYSVGGDDWTAGLYPTTRKGKRLYFGSEGKLYDTPQPLTILSYRYDPEVRLGYFKYFDFYEAPAPGVAGVQTFFSAPFAEEYRFMGKVRWQMEVSSDCEDTAFFMRVYLVTEAGKAYNLTETITALSYIAPDYHPGETVQIDLETPPIAFALQPGMRLRVDIASDGGIYVPHANVRGHWAQVSASKIAHNTLYCGQGFIEI